MVHINKFKPNTPYNPKTKVRMPEKVKSPKKGTLYTILAPSIEAEMSYIADSEYLVFNNLWRYVITKRFPVKVQGQSLMKYTPNSNGDITAMITNYNSSKNINFSKLDSVTTIKENQKLDTIKGFNTLLEINYELYQQVFNNEHDKRYFYLKMSSFFSNMKGAIKAFTEHPAYAALDNRYLIIPLHYWGSKDDYKNLKFVPKTSTFINVLLNFMENNIDEFNDIFEGYTILLDYENKWFKLEPASYEFASDMTADIRKFIKRCIMISENKTTKAEVAEDEKNLREVKLTSAATEEVERNLEKSNINPENLTEERLENLENLVKVEIDDDTGEAKVVQKLEKLQSEEAMEDLINAKLEGKTLANYQRDKVLRKKYTELKINDDNITDLIEHDVEAEKIPEYKIKTASINEDMANIPSYNFEKSYNEELAQYDFANILIHFASCKPALYLINDPIVEDISDTENKMYKCTVTYEDETRKRHRFSFKMPKWYKERYLRINGQLWTIIHQKMLFPISKTEPNLCQVSSNYNKIRMTRYGTNISSKITKLKKILLAEDQKYKVKIERGNNIIPNNIYPTTIEYDSLGEDFYKLKLKTITIFFNMEDAIALVGMPKDDIFSKINDSCIYPLGIDNASKTKFYISGSSNLIYDDKGETYGELSDFLIDKIEKENAGFAKEFDGLSAGTKFTYTRAKILHYEVPLVLIVSAADPGGLQAVLNKGHIKHEFHTTRPTKMDKDNQGVVQFNDGFLVFDRYPYENSLLLNGLSSFPTREYNFFDMDSRDTYIAIFDDMFSNRTMIDGIENFYYLLIDPITKDILNRIHQPDKFTELMLFANAKLSDNSYRLDADYFESRIRSNELLNVFLYQELCTAYANWKIGRTPTFSIPEDAIIKKCMESNIIESHTTLNTVLELENDRQVKLKGPGGMNEDRSFTMDKRAYLSSMRGIIGMNSVPSGEVGINRHMTLNCNITNPRGFVEINKDEYNGTELNTPGELLNTFGTESADIERVAMAITQSKHLVPTEKSSESIVSYDMERVVPHISNDFSFVAKNNGKVVEIAEGIMIVQYEDGTFDDIDLMEHPDKNTDGGFYIMNTFVTDLKVGDKFEKHDVLAYEPKFIKPKDEFGDYTSSVGTLARVAIVSNGDVYEDSGVITEKFANEVAAKITKEKSIILSQYSNIKKMVKIGDKVVANEPLLLFDDTRDEFTSQMLSTMAANAGDEDEILSSSAPLFSKVSGTVKDIKIYYTVPVEDMSPSLQKIIKEYNASVKKREKVINKYIDSRDQNTFLTPSEPIEPDAQGRVNGSKIGSGVKISFFIEVRDVAGVGDKLTNYTAIKMTTCKVIPKGLEPFTKFNPDRKIDAYTSTIGLYKRMCLDVFKVGGLGKILISRKWQLKNKYLERLEKEVKKK